MSWEKRFERQRTEGRYGMLQCAHGRFHRVVPLLVTVRSAPSKGSYERGVLKIELTKVKPGEPKVHTINVN